VLTPVAHLFFNAGLFRTFYFTPFDRIIDVYYDCVESRFINAAVVQAYSHRLRRIINIFNAWIRLGQYIVIPFKITL